MSEVISKEFLMGIGFILVSTYILTRIIRFREQAIFLWSGNIIRKKNNPKDYYPRFALLLFGASSGLLAGIILLTINLI